MYKKKKIVHNGRMVKPAPKLMRTGVDKALSIREASKEIPASCGACGARNYECTLHTVDTKRVETLYELRCGNMVNLFCEECLLELRGLINETLKEKTAVEADELYRQMRFFGIVDDVKNWLDERKGSDALLAEFDTTSEDILADEDLVFAIAGRVCDRMTVSESLESVIEASTLYVLMDRKEGKNNG